MAGRIGSGSTNIVQASPFLGGLNTELSGVVDSTDFTKDELNMLIKPDGTRSRRFGVDYEENFSLSDTSVDIDIKDLAFNAIEWTDINTPDEVENYKSVPYIVVQVGGKILFYNNTGAPYSSNENEFSLDLAEYAIDPSKDDYKKERCKFASAYGCLFITSKAIKTIRLKSANKEEEQSFVITNPYCTVTCSAFQGKHQRMKDIRTWEGYPMTEHYSAWYDFKINGVKIARFYGEPNKQFPNSYTMAQNFNSLPEEVRLGIIAEPFETVAYKWTNKNSGWPNWTPYDYITFKAPSPNLKGFEIGIDVRGWAYKSGSWREHKKKYSSVMAGGSSNYTQTVGVALQIRDTSTGANDYLAIDENPEKLSYAHLYNLLNQGWTPKLIADFYEAYVVDDTHYFPANNLAQQYLKDSKTTSFKPEALLNTTFGNTPAGRGHFKLDFFSQDKVLTSGLTAAMITIAGKLSKTVDDIIDKDFPGYDPELSALEQAYKQVPTRNPRNNYITDICAYAGRIFYLCGDMLLYSQVISEDISRANMCYTDADPTSEELSDVIETDGGTISLPEIGEGVKLVQLGSYLFVFGTRGTFVIAGTDNNIFTATAYTAGSLSAIPSQAPNSFVETEYGILYWGTTGIQLLSASNGIGVQDLSTDRILSFYGKLTNEQHKYCKGIYSASGKKVYWLYPSDPENAPRKLDMILVFDLIHSAFIPQAISDGRIIEGEYTTEDTPEIVSGLSLKVPFKGIKEYPITSLVEHPANYELKGTARIEGNLLSTVGEWADIRPQGMIYTPEISSETADMIEVSTTITPYKLDRASTIIALYKRGETYTDYVDHGIARARVGISVNNALNMSYRRSAEDSWTHIEGWETNYILQVGKSYEIELRLQLNANVSMILRVREVGEEAWHIFSKVVQYPSTISLYGWMSYIGEPVYTLSENPSIGDSVYYYGGEGLIVAGTIKDITLDTYGRVLGFKSKEISHYGFSRFAGLDKQISKIFYSPCTLCLAGETAGYFFGNWWFNGTIDLSKTSLLLDGTRELFSLEEAITDNYEVVDDNGVKILADDPIESEEFSYESSILLCLDVANAKVTFGDFRSNLLRDWVAGDYQGVGYTFDSYLISHPMNSTSINQYGQRVGNTFTTKSIPNFIAGFRRTETGATTEGEYLYPSACQGSVLWNWATSGKFGKWDAPQELYRPNKRTIFDDGYVFTRSNVRGLGKAYQLKLQSVEDKQFILESLVFNVQNDGRI